MLNLDFHHHTIRVRCNESSLLQKLEDEFHFFISKETNAPETTLDLSVESLPVLPPLVAHKILETAVLYKEGPIHYVDYFGEALTVWDKARNNISIYSPNQERLFELAFLAVHSLLGQKLDQDGLCRIHAVALSKNGINAIVMLPSKGGKSTLLKHALREDDIKIISDDMPLCDLQGRIFPFPSKLSLNEVPTTVPLSNLTWHAFKRQYYPTKYTASLSQLKNRLELHPEENKNLLIAGFRRSSGPAVLEEVPKWKMVKPLFEHMIFGLGLPQVIELFLSFSARDLIKLPYHAFMRARCAFSLAMKSRCFYFTMGPDTLLNAQQLLDLMNEHKAT